MPLQVGYQSQTLPPWLNDLYREIAQRSRDISFSPFEPYTAGRMAPLHPHLQTAHRLSSQNIGLAEPALNLAQQYGQQAAQPFTRAARDEYMSPYINDVVSRIATEGNRNFTRNVLPALEHQFAAHGAHGSSRHRELATEAARDMQDRILAAQQGALHQGYEHAGRLHASDQARALQASENMRSLGAARQAGNLADIQQLTSAGEREQGQRQAELQTQYEDTMNRLRYPQQRLQEHAGLMSSVPTPTQTYQAQQAQAPYQWNQAGQIGNLAASLYGMRMAHQGGRGYKKGGSVKGNFPKFPKFPKIPKLGEGKKLGAQSLTQTSFIRQPKVGAKHGMKKRII